MARVSCQGFFETTDKCKLKAEFVVVVVGTAHRFACRFCKKGKKVVRKL